MPVDTAMLLVWSDRIRYRLSRYECTWFFCRFHFFCCCCIRCNRFLSKLLIRQRYVKSRDIVFVFLIKHCLSGHSHAFCDRQKGIPLNWRKILMFWKSIFIPILRFILDTNDTICQWMKSDIIQKICVRDDVKPNKILARMYDTISNLRLEH